jgi:inorganic pyrophosphatase
VLSAAGLLAGCGPTPNYLVGFEAVNEDGTVNAVIEIAAGTSAKFEVTADGSAIEQDQIDGRPRFIEYLPYPANYGMIPRTLEDPALGGDGDPLDVIVLGEALGRGDVLAVRIIGVLRMIDTGERDDKLIAVVPGTPLAAAGDIAELDRMFPGVTGILRTWFTNYKGPGRVEIESIEDAAAAQRILEGAAAAFERNREQLP